MPIGIIVSSASALAGGLFGTALGKHLPERTKATLPSIFAVSAAAIGITLICQVNNLTAVVLSLIVGTIIGEGIDINGGIQRIVARLNNYFPNTVIGTKENNVFMTLIMLYCFSATGTFGALIEGFTGEYNILLTKSVLDFFTAAIFATEVGIIVSFISIPQFLIYLVLFMFAK